MASYSSNLAYDFGKFDRAARARRRSAAAVKTEAAVRSVAPNFSAQVREVSGRDKAQAKARSPKLRRLFIGCLFCIALAGVVVFNQAKLTELNKSIISTTNKIAVLEEEYRQKSLELERKVDIRTAEEVAKNDYGMVTADNSQMYYVALPVDESQAGIRSEGGLFAKISRFFEQVFAYISGN